LTAPAGFASRRSALGEWSAALLAHRADLKEIDPAPFSPIRPTWSSAPGKSHIWYFLASWAGLQFASKARADFAYKLYLSKNSSAR
jgi:hypothetical protein